MVNGFYTSKPQLAIHELLGGEVNRREWRYGIDVAILLDGVAIAVEYDCWYWHQDRVDKDAKRDAFLQSRGWRMLHIKSANLVPTIDQLNAAINRLVQGSLYEEIVLGDWQG